MWSCNFIPSTSARLGVEGECSVSVELLWNRLSGFISPSHLYLRRNVASGLKPISITFLHFINFRTITREPSFDSGSSSLSCTPQRSLRGWVTKPHWTLTLCSFHLLRACLRWWLKRRQKGERVISHICKLLYELPQYPYLIWMCWSNRYSTGHSHISDNPVWWVPLKLRSLIGFLPLSFPLLWICRYPLPFELNILCCDDLVRHSGAR